ncbi:MULTISPECIES: TetR/AcrR family transcriptional regulator [Pseudescherichia]|uniref:TetR/AcrR family transcriptional regulator n=1 Tax=Pseudescherichia TaxID=2055880 RepID=UPI002899CD8A|nr:TetR/AcrR family transcriptional regulator [Pseudescherichia sp.]
MARPKSEDKKQALLEAAAEAFAQSGITASTALIARNAGVAEGTLFRYFATKDDLLNAVYLALKTDLCHAMLDGLDRSLSEAKALTRYIWNSYIDWGILHPVGHRAIRQLAVSGKITCATQQNVDELFPDLHTLCRRSVLPIFLTEAFHAFGDALFLSLAETTIEFASREPEKADDIKAHGFEAMWRALADSSSSG